MNVLKVIKKNTNEYAKKYWKKMKEATEDMEEK